MAVVVTGASGFIGRAVVRFLAAAGERVVAVDRRPAPESPSGAALALQADLLDRDELVSVALDEADAVVHLAGCPGVRDAAPDVEWRRHRDNVLATAAVLDRVRRDTPVVVTSSSSVYGGSTGRPSRECDAVRPRGGYAASKVRVEELCQRHLAAGGVVSIARPFTVVGEHQRSDMALSRWLADAAAGRPLTVLGSLERTRDLTDVRDVAAALCALAAAGARGPVNVGSGRGHSLAQMVQAVSTVLGVAVETRVRRATAEEPPDTLADPSRLRALTGVVPVTDLVEVVRRQAVAAGALVGARTT